MAGLHRLSREGETTHIWRETIAQEDDDEWGLQAKIVSTLARTLKRRLTEFTLAPPPSVVSNPPTVAVPVVALMVIAPPSV